MLNSLGLIAFSSSYSKAFTAGKHTKSIISLKCVVIFSAAATNAFRLHSRLRGTQHRVFSREFLQTLVLEDSAHYLLYVSFLSIKIFRPKASHVSVLGVYFIVAGYKSVF